MLKFQLHYSQNEREIPSSVLAFDNPSERFLREAKITSKRKISGFSGFMMISEHLFQK